ncbi:MAG: transcriptional regulator [Actinoplanes sp.]
MTDLVLHTLRCIGFAGLSRVADASSLAEPEVESRLIDLAVAGLVTRTAGEFRAWGLTEAGRAEDASRTARELDAGGARGAVTEAYGKFLELNPELLDLCSAWHLRAERGIPAERVLAAFGDLDQRAEAVCADLAAAVPRFGRYRVRLGDALGRARGGALEHLTDTLDSYHNVWFQLHEDLLATLGIPR